MCYFRVNDLQGRIRRIDRCGEMQAELELGANAVKFMGAAPQPPRQRTESVFHIRVREGRIETTTQTAIFCHYSSILLQYTSRTRHATMILSIQPALVLSLAFAASLVRAQYDAKLVGTWTTKSKKVMTGPVRSLNLDRERSPANLRV
jgi:hypothetical protein